MRVGLRGGCTSDNCVWSLLCAIYSHTCAAASHVGAPKGGPRGALIHIAIVRLDFGHLTGSQSPALVVRAYICVCRQVRAGEGGGGGGGGFEENKPHHKRKE